MTFKKATKEQAKLRAAFHGPSGSGKTFSALSVGMMLLEPGQRLAVIDTERGSASKYVGKKHPVDGVCFDFDVLEINGDYHPNRCIKALDEAASDGGFGAVVVDSGTHFWNSIGGFLQLVDAEAKRAAAKGGKYDSFGAWKTVDPVYQNLIQAITTSPLHVIFTLRAKQAYEKVEDDRGKAKIQKMGMAPQMRDDFQYEFDLEGMINIDHDFVVGKTRFDSVDGKVFHKPGGDLARALLAELTDGAPMRERPRADAKPTAMTTADEMKLGLDVQDKLNGAETLSDVAAISAEFTPALKRASSDVQAKAKQLFADARARLTKAAEVEQAMAEAS